VARSLSFAGDPAAGLARLEGSLQEFLQEMTGFMPPARGAVFLALLVYLFAGFLLPYHLLARRGRREWSYAVVVVAAVVATVAIYRYGVLSAMNDAEAEEVTVLRLHRDGSAAEATSFIAAISPRYTQLDPGEGFLGDEEGAAREPRPRALVPGNRAIPRGAGPVEMDARGGLRHPPVTLYPNEARFFRYDYQVPVSRLATVEYVRDEDLQQDQIRFTNRTRSASVVYQQSLFGEFQVDRRLDPAVSDTIAPQRARPVRPPYRLLDPRWSEDQSDAEHNVRTRLRQSNQDTIAGKASEVVFASLHRQDARLAGGARPRYFAASFSEGVFPGLQSFRRKAVTVLFVEIPPAGFH
jgi:hypothetical protein